MKKQSLLFILIITLFLPAVAQQPSLAQFDFLLGSWEMKNAKGNIVEVWTKEKHGLAAKSYVYHSNGRRVLTEKIKLRAKDNTFYLWVTGFEKGNRGTTLFKLIATAQQTFIFENKKQRFPQRVIYQNNGKTVLLAWIEGYLDGEKMKVEFRYQRKDLRS